MKLILKWAGIVQSLRDASQCMLAQCNSFGSGEHFELEKKLKMKKMTNLSFFALCVAILLCVV